MVCSSITRTNDTLVRFGKRGWPSISAPSASQFGGKAIDENHALGIADIQDGHFLRAALRAAGCSESRAASNTGEPMFISNRNRRPLRCEQAQMLGPAPVWMVT